MKLIVPGGLSMLETSFSRALYTACTSLARHSRILVDYDAIASNFRALKAAVGPEMLVVPTVCFRPPAGVLVTI